MAYTWRRLNRDPLAVVGIATIAAISFAALSAPLIAPFDPTEQFFDGLTLEGAPLPPGETFFLGTDLLGRDLRCSAGGDLLLKPVEALIGDAAADDRSHLLLEPIEALMRHDAADRLSNPLLKAIEAVLRKLLLSAA